MTELQLLAREVLHMRALQKRYAASRCAQTLAEVRDAERRLEARCQDILYPPQNQPDLFASDADATND